MPTTIDSLIVSLGLDPSNFDKGQKDAVAALKKIGEQAEKSNKSVSAGGKVMAESFDLAAKAALGLFAILAGGKALASLTAVAQTDAAVGRLAKNLDMLPGKVKTFENAAVAAGSSAGSMDTALSNLSGGMEAIDRGQQTPLLSILNQLHLSSKDPSTGKDKEAGELFLEISDKLSKMDPRDASYYGSALGYDSGIISMSEQGSGAIQQLMAQNQSNLDQQTIDASNNLIKAFGRLETATDNVGNDLLKKFGPDVDAALDHFTLGLVDFDKVLHGKMTIGQFLATSGVGQVASAIASGADALQGKILPHPITGATAAEIAARNQGLAYFESQGWTAKQAAGIMANAYAETGGTYLPGTTSPADSQGRTAYGVFQWRGARKAALFAKYGPNPTYAQELAFYQNELMTSESSTAAALRATTTAFGAGVVVDKYDQRSGDSLAAQMARGAVASGFAMMKPGGVPLSAQRVLASLRAQSRTVNVTNNVRIDAKTSDARGIARELRKTTASTITAARMNTGLD